MNAEEVRKMIDTIYEGEFCPLPIGEGAHKSIFGFHESTVRISHDEQATWPTEIRSPRQARELAGALVAWACVQEYKVKFTAEVDEAMKRLGE